MVFDLTTIERATETIVNYLHIDKTDLLNYLDQHNFDFDIYTFLKDFHIDHHDLDVTGHSLIAFHLTSSNNSCDDFKKNGIMGAKDAINTENALSEYLKEQEILFNKEHTYFTYADTIYNIEQYNLYERLVENHVHCFLSVDDTGYFSEQLQVRPDIITLISEIVGEDNIKDFWDANHETYMIKYCDVLEAFDYESICQTNSIHDAILQLLLYAVDMILFNGHVEISAWMKKNHVIKPSNIIYIRQYYNN